MKKGMFLVFVLSLLLDAGAWAGVCSDWDGDTVCEAQDNCPCISNPLQGDADGDQVGNRCDGDLDNNLPIVNNADLVLFKACFGSLSATHPQCDFDESGPIINNLDLGMFKAMFGRLVGPGLGGACP